MTRAFSTSLGATCLRLLIGMADEGVAARASKPPAARTNAVNFMKVSLQSVVAERKLPTLVAGPASS
jgi:hypothetical protein